jgi:flagellar hook-associated protein 2
MGSIQSSVGLITGLNIADTIKSLMSLEAAPRDRLTARQTALKTEQTGLIDLTTLVVGLQLIGKNLARPQLFRTKSATSSNAGLVTATVTGKPALGSYTVTPVRQVRSQQTLSSSVASKTAALGVGTITLAQGGQVDDGVALDALNGGQGVQRGKIKITDRSGATTTIDLRFAQTIDDVLTAINGSEDISVTASVVGDSIKLTDDSGQAAANLRVQEVSGGTTAAGLGLSGINAAANTATGADVLSLSSGVEVGRLNDGSGLSIRSSVADLQFTFRDQTTLDLQFTGSEKSLGDVLSRINTVAAGKIEAKISASGDTLEFKDLTTDSGGTFSVVNLTNGGLKEDLGLTSAAVGDTLTSGRLLGGLKTSLLRSLGGGQGLGALGSLSLTDRSGASASVDLSSAKTLEDVIVSINAAGLGITASVNDARNGLVLTDTTGSATSNLIVANGDGTNSATKLKIEVDAAVTKINSKSLAKQFVSEGTQLSTLNGGAGVKLGKIVVQDGSGSTTVLDLKTLGVETVGDVVEAFNSLSIDVRAKINDAGDGILVYDTSGDGGQVIITDVGGNTTAKDLHLDGVSGIVTVNGQSVHAVDGSTTLTVNLDSDDSLQDLADKLNALGGPAAASIITSSASSSQFELSLISNRGGAAGRFILDLSAIGLSTSTPIDGQDALAAVTQNLGGVTRLHTSTDNNFAGAIEGLTLSLKGSSTESISISVTESNSGVASTLQQFVDQYNKIRDKLTSLNFYNEETKQRGPLFGSSTALRIENELSRLATNRLVGVGDIGSLASLGITLTDTGKMVLDSTKLQDKLLADPNGVEQFFTESTRGFAKKLDELSERLAGVNSSLLLSRNNTLQQQIDGFQLRIDVMTERLARRKTVLETKFYNLELAVQKIQSNQSAITTLTNLASAFSSN